MGKQMLAYGMGLSEAQEVCYQVYQDESGRCKDANEGVKACMDKASESRRECSDAHRPPRDVQLEEYAIQAVISLAIGYLVLLTIRTIGWIAAGFGRTDPDHTSA